MTFPGHRALGDHTWDEVANALGLSVRELDVVKGIFDELTERAIGAELGISPHTVHTHVERIFRKVDARSRVGISVQVLAAYLRSEAGTYPSSLTAARTTTP